MAGSEAPPPPLADDRCPRCAASDVVLSLLTSMTRYFVCRRCNYRWQIATAGSTDEPS